jgi:NADH dehydrogenase FAD-containing subunit
MDHLNSSDIKVILNDRVLHLDPAARTTKASLTTTSGLTLTADIILRCTGQTPHSQLLSTLSLNSINPKTNRIIVTPTLQLAEQSMSHIFAVGDCADSGAIQAGHTAWHQGDLAARNLIKLVLNGGEEIGAGLVDYVYGGPGIKVTLGLVSRTGS